MANLLRNRVTLVWLLLVGATLISFESGTSGHSRSARAIVLAIAFAKAVAVGRAFMELRDAPRWCPSLSSASIRYSRKLALGLFDKLPGFI